MHENGKLDLGPCFSILTVQCNGLFDSYLICRRGLSRESVGERNGRAKEATNGLPISVSSRRSQDVSC